MNPKVHIVLLNWNGWEDTVECLESVLRLDYDSFKVVVCDNDSRDGSLEKIKAWADGELAAPLSSPSLATLTFPPLVKPVSYIEYSRLASEQEALRGQSAKLTLIQTGSNLGFAGGNNVGVRYALAQGADYVWLLNNDTVVDSDALAKLVERASVDKDVGIVGSTLRFYGDPERLQALGGATFIPWRCRAQPIGIGSLYREISPAQQGEIEQQTAYVIGASMLVSRSFLETVGLISEDYFLYYEELDWARRASGKFKLAYAPESHVFHKVGAAAGNGSLFSLGYMFRSRLRFMNTFFPHLMVTTRFWLLVDGAKAALKGRLREGLLAASVAFSSVNSIKQP
ncbi:MAG: glycosyltransferase family 2 protein [Azonexus sp.]